MADPEIQQIITAGEQLARHVKEAYWPGIPWSPTIAFHAGYKMAAIKKLTRNLYEGLNDVQFLHELGKYSSEDLIEVLPRDKVTEEHTFKPPYLREDNP
jgi:hypothetical protein